MSARSLAPFGMTTSISNVSVAESPRAESQSEESVNSAPRAPTARRHTLASRLAFLTICLAIVLTTLAYGTVHYWALAFFSLSAAGLICLWSIDGLVLRSVQISRNPLQWPLLGMILLGLVQLLPL